MPRIDVGRLTAEETADLLRECIAALPEESLFEVLNEALTSEQKSELAMTWIEEK